MSKKSSYKQFRTEIEAAINALQSEGECLDLLQMYNKPISEGQITLMFYGDFSAKYRIVVTYLGKKYALCWLQFCKDGSLYFGVRDNIVSPRKAGTVKSKDGLIEINLKDELPPQLPEGAKTSNKFSFHGSGIIHDIEFGHTTHRIPIKDTNELSELFGVCFKELSEYEEIQQLRQNDIIINTHIPEKHMFIMRVYIAPHDKIKPNGINDGQGNVFVIISFNDTESKLNLSLQIEFGIGRTSEAPPRTVVFWPTIDDNSSSKNED